MRKRLLGAGIVLLVMATLFAMAGCKLFNTAPVIWISANPLTGKAPLKVIFRADITDEKEEECVCEWYFGDGETGSGSTVVHTFRNVGNYTVELKVTDGDGAVTSARQSIEVTNPGPTCDGIAFRNSGDCINCGMPYCAQRKIQISVINPRPGMNELYITGYDWSFGDGTTDTVSDTSVMNHIYQYAGIYTVRVTIADSGGISNTFTDTVAIENCCRPCLRNIYIIASDCYRVGHSMKLCGDFRPDGHSGCSRLAEALEMSAKSGAPIDPKVYCGDSEPCDCGGPCNNCGCLDGEWEWRIRMPGGNEIIEYGKCIYVTPCQTGSLTVRLFYTCGGRSTYTAETFEISD